MADGLTVGHDTGWTHIVLGAPHGNAITDRMVEAMRAAIAGMPAATKLLTIETSGVDFSFGSSLDEHRPARIREVLPRFHALISDLLRAPAVTAAVVRGRCLGGGFELALACDLIFASDDAVFGLPEVRVGAFPPVGSILLPWRVGASRAASAILTGREQSASYWRSAGLLEAVAPGRTLDAVVHEWFDAHLAGLSAATLRHATTASRSAVRSAVGSLLPGVEQTYLCDLLSTADAAEGVEAFLEKRPPRWQDR